MDEALEAVTFKGVTFIAYGAHPGKSAYTTNSKYSRYTMFLIQELSNGNLEM
jgi:hypothetical protein